MYIYAAAISASLNNKIHITCVSFHHDSRDLDEVEKYALEEIAYFEFPMKRGYQEHNAVVDSPEDEWVISSANYLKKGN